MTGVIFFGSAVRQSTGKVDFVRASMDKAKLTANSQLDVSASAESLRECQIAEILQFSCAIQPSEHGSQQFHCFPIPRLFML